MLSEVRASCKCCNSTVVTSNVDVFSNFFPPVFVLAVLSGETVQGPNMTVCIFDIFNPAVGVTKSK